MRYPARIPREVPGSKHERQEGDCPQHRAFVRRHNCVVNNGECGGRVQCCHYRTAANSGTSKKPHDMYSFPGCGHHHDEQHRIGQKAFEYKYGLNLLNECMILAARSPALRRIK